MKVALLTTDNREHERDYAQTEPRFGVAVAALLEGLERVPELEVHVVSCTQRPLVSPKKLGSSIFYHSLHVPKLGWLRTVYQGCIRAVRRKLKEIQPDIVHGQGTERDCAISAVFSGFPNAVTIHGNMAELARRFRAPVGGFGWLAARLENFTLPRTGGVFCNSEYTEDLVKLRTRRAWRVPNAIREQFFTPPPASPSPGAQSGSDGEGRGGARRASEQNLMVANALRSCTVLNVGVISARKRQLELLQVARELRKLELDFVFQFVGAADPKDPYAAAFLEQIKPLEREGCALYTGMKSTTELVNVFDFSAALVHFPSEEAFGLVVAEALARNLKLFGTRTGGIMDISDGAPGVELFDVDDWPGLTSAIACWIRSGSQRAPGCTEVMRSRYHPNLIARRHVEIYREIISAARTPA